MKYLMFLAFIICSTASSADLDCKQLSKIADENGTMFGTKYFFTLQGQKGFRSYFHNAPSSQCKNSKLFLIPDDTVVAYQQFNYEGISWLYVMYIDKQGRDTSGWMKDQDFKLSSQLSMND